MSKKQYSEQFRRDAVALWKKSDKTQQEIADSLGIHSADPDGGSLTVTEVDGASHGSALVGADGTFREQDVHIWRY